MFLVLLLFIPHRNVPHFNNKVQPVEVIRGNIRSYLRIVQDPSV